MYNSVHDRGCGDITASLLEGKSTGVVVRRLAGSVCWRFDELSRGRQVYKLVTRFYPEELIGMLVFKAAFAIKAGE